MLRHNLKYFFLLLFLVPSFAQEIDSSLLNNLSQEQLEAVRAQVNSSGIENRSNPSPKVTESTIRVASGDMNKVGGKKYGYGYFSSVPTNIAALGDLPLPNEYKISLKDQFTIILSGSREAIFDVDVRLDGTILFPELGSISVIGETFAEVKRKLNNIVNQSYIGVDIDISLKNLAAKKITIVGAVKTPGTYMVNPFSTITSALAYSGGVSEIGTLRNIKLIRTNGEVYYFDLYQLLIKGDRSKDITVEAGDVILIEAANQFIEIAGEVNRQAIYEIKESEKLNDLVDFALGYKNIANLKNITLTKLDIAKSQIEQITTDDVTSDLKNVLAVNIYGYVNKEESSVFISGAVKEPGFYDLDDNTFLKDIINKVEFIDVYPWVAVLEQFDDNELVRTSKLFSLNDETTYEDLKVLPRSKIYFANIYDRRFDGINTFSNQLLNDYQLLIKHKQGTFSVPVIGEYSLSAFIDLLGLDMSDVDKNAIYISPLDNLVIEDTYFNMNFKAKKYNRVAFRSPVNDLITVTIKGAIDYPGTYVLNSDATLQDLYNQVGNFKSEAFLNGIIFTRESIRLRQLKAIQKSQQSLNESLLIATQKGENIGDIGVIKALSQQIEPENLGRIAGNFMPNSKLASETILFEGDQIFVPKNPYTINVLGEVLNPISFEYTKNATVRSAINNAGGYRDYAKKSGVYVIKATGLIEKANRNIFVKNVNLEPGDTIVVPRKIITNNPGLEVLLPVTQILSDIAFSAAAIESLSNN